MRAALLPLKDLGSLVSVWGEFKGLFWLQNRGTVSAPILITFYAVPCWSNLPSIDSVLSTCPLLCPMEPTSRLVLGLLVRQQPSGIASVHMSQHDNCSFFKSSVCLSMKNKVIFLWYFLKHLSHAYRFLFSAKSSVLDCK